jgi:hypothetical protein
MLLAAVPLSVHEFPVDNCCSGYIQAAVVVCAPQHFGQGGLCLMGGGVDIGGEMCKVNYVATTVCWDRSIEPPCLLAVWCCITRTIG